MLVGDGTIPLVCGCIAPLGKCTTLHYQSVGRLNKWLVLRCLLPVWTRSLVLRAALAKAVLAYPQRLSKQAWKTPYELSLVLSSAYMKLIWHGHSSWLLLVCGCYVGLFPVQAERKSQLTTASWESLDLLIWPKLCGDPLKESVLCFLSPSFSCLKASEAQWACTHLF